MNMLKKCQKSLIVKTWVTIMIYTCVPMGLLADVFENFRTFSVEQYKLDPCHYYTSPGLSWNALLKKTNIKLEPFTDID